MCNILVKKLYVYKLFCFNNKTKVLSKWRGTGNISTHACVKMSSTPIHEQTTLILTLVSVFNFQPSERCTTRFLYFFCRFMHVFMQLSAIVDTLYRKFTNFPPYATGNLKVCRVNKATCCSWVLFECSKSFLYCRG